MDFVEKLKHERKKIEVERAKACAKYDREIAEIDAAINAVLKNRVSAPPQPHATAIRSSGSPIRIDDAIVEAVSTGTNTPAKILDFLTEHLGIETTINSVRTRVSRLKNEGRLVRGERGWATPGDTNDSGRQAAPDGKADTKRSSESREAGVSDKAPKAPEMQ